jgi:hypothetical protein
VLTHNGTPRDPPPGAVGRDWLRTRKAAIVLSAKAYVGPSGSCAVDYLSETASPKGAIFSARLLCPSPGAAAKKTVVNLMFASDGSGQVSFGPAFASLKPYRRCAVRSQQ